MNRARVVLVLTAIIVAFALATGFPVFHRMFYVFGLLLVTGYLWAWLLLRGIRSEVRRPVLHTRAGEGISEKVTIRPWARFLWGFIEVQEHTDMPVVPPAAVLSLDSADSRTIDLEIPCPRRGVFQLGPLRVIASDPLGLFRLSRNSGEAQRLTVHPATIDLPGFILLPADLPGEGPVHLRSQHVTASAYSVRDYVFGDSLKRISWKSTAHHNKLMVKEFELEPANNVWVLVDMERRSHFGAGERSTEETAITLGASVCKRYLDANYPVGFLSYGNERFIMSAQRGPPHLLRIMDALAELRAQGNISLLNVMGELHTRAGRYTSVVIITPSTSDAWLDGVRHLLERRSRITVVVIDADLEGEDHPRVAYEAAAMGVPTYTIKRGAEATEGLIALGAPSMARASAR